MIFAASSTAHGPRASRVWATILGVVGLVAAGAFPSSGVDTAAAAPTTKTITHGMASLGTVSATTASMLSDPEWWQCSGVLCVEEIWWGPDAAPQSTDIEMTTGGMWYAIYNDSWLALDPDSGDESPDPLVLTVEENTTGQPRSDTVTIVAGTYSIDIVVVQGPTTGPECASSYLCVSQAWWGPNALPQSIDLDITTGGVWSASTSESWLSVDPSSGVTEPDPFQVSVEENETNSPRSGTVTITGGTGSVDLLVYQGPAESPL
ncbi:MAG: hypothetical protein FWD59_05165 [Micrococcales bacterium]|nr:hypothetical protein [Micrococcales bacterium]